ncbi:MAG: nitroreductase family protein [Bifidobacteriaceae bacterium]|nr:nitroreductase family protein [Bifidobacteriaceae bacterium]
MDAIYSGLADRRSIYALGKDIPASDDEVIDFIRRTTELVPDAFNMKSQRVVVVLGEKQDALWDTVYDVFGGKVAREKIDGFKAAHGTVLYFYDDAVINAMQEKVPAYAQNFPIWALQSNGMLQFSVWTGLRAMGIGANLQHYNPVIDDAVKKMFGLPDTYVLLAQMPFGSIKALPDPKPAEDVDRRVTIAR